tara:strand:- start:573 stop:794 length:222 start_codon:yes stop_codon:yes gene_type:complete
MEENKIKEVLETHIRENPEQYPFIAQFWDIKVEKMENKKLNLVSFGHHNTINTHSHAFYKPFSKTIDFFKLDE